MEPFWIGLLALEVFAEGALGCIFAAHAQSSDWLMCNILTLGSAI